MKDMFFKEMMIPLVLGVLIVFCSVGYAENIDPEDNDTQYAWCENMGWINAEPLGNGGPGMDVGDADVNGYLWGENIGWISLSCLNTANCGTVNYGVNNDGAGNLSGYAWGENVGWISFSCTNTGTCDLVAYGVSIDPVNGIFSGYAWAENIGWINFEPIEGGLKTSWRQDADGDGYTVDVDCDDTDAEINPSAYELPGNIIDENCDGSLGACDPNAFWRNHGRFVQCVAHETDALIDMGVLTEEEGDMLISSAAQSDVGKR